MQMAPWLLPAMRRRYRGADTPVDELRVFDAREVPAPLAAMHGTEDAQIGGARCTWIAPERRQAGVVVFLHGGAYVFGPGPGHWDWLCALCELTGTAGLLVRYARAPEARFPVALDQVVQVCLAQDDPWVLAGDSAGGGLALAAAFRLRDSAARLPAGLALSSPWMDLTMEHPEMRAHQQVDVMLGVDRLAAYAGDYAGAADMRDPHVSPAFGDPRGLPPMLITSGGAELMRWEIRDWARACADAGTTCDLIEVEGAIHDFAMARTLFPEAREVLPAFAEFVAAAVKR